MRGFLEAWERVTIAAEELAGADDCVVVAAVQRAVGRGSGAEPTELRYFHVWTFQGPDRRVQGGRWRRRRIPWYSRGIGLIKRNLATPERWPSG
jgi:hypothetical protein